MVIGLVGIEFQDSRHPDFHQFQDIFFGHFAFQFWLPGFEAKVNVVHGFIHIGRILKLFILIDAFFDEYFFE